MKKVTLQAIYDTLTMPEMEGKVSTDVLTELEKELNKGAEEKAAKVAAYEVLHDFIVNNLTGSPCTCGELWDAIKDDVPEGTTKGKVQYALTHLWQDEIVKIEGKPNTYRKA